MTETAADEQDLAKALDSVANAADGYSSSNTTSTTVADNTVSPALPPVMPTSTYAPAPEPTTPPNPFSTPLLSPLGSENSYNNSNNNTPVVSTPAYSSTDSSAPAPSGEPVVTGPLADIKNEALNELRPLVDKLNVSPEEKFDTLLLLIRSTDDSSLIAPAHEAAKGIQDDSRKAEALLDIIKEIDYLSRQDKTTN